MILSVFDKHLRKVAMIETWVSLYWKADYNGIGQFTFEATKTDKLQSVLKKGYFCTLSDDIDESTMVISAVETTENRIIAHGFTANSLLALRSMNDKIEAGTDGQTAIETLVENTLESPTDSKRGLNNFIVYHNENVISGNISLDIEKQSVLDACKKISNDIDIGYKVQKQGDNLIFQCYGGYQTRTLSESRGEIADVSILDADNDFYNVAVIFGTDANGNEIKETVFFGLIEQSGFNRREIVVDYARTQASGETIEDYREQMRTKGRNVLLEHFSTFSANAFVRRKDVLLGDLINLYIDGKVLTNRVTSAIIKTSGGNIERNVELTALSEPNFAAESGLYSTDGELLKTWDQLKAEYPSWFTTPGEISTIGLVSPVKELEGFIIVDEEITKIGNLAFNDCSKLTRIILPSTVESIGGFAFANCNIESIELPNSLVSIGTGAFQYCIKLKDISLPNGLTSIGSLAFSRCTTLESVYLHSESSTTKVTFAGGSWFVGCSPNLVIHYPASVTNPQEAYGQYWDYISSTQRATTIADL